MKKIRLLLVVLALFGMIAPSEATVLVFKGNSSRFKGDQSSASKVPTTVFFVVQFDGGSANSNYFVFVSNSKKTASMNGPRGFGSIQVATTPTATGFLVSNSATSTQSLYVRFQGVLSAIQPVEGQGTIPYPKTLTGTFCDIDIPSPVFLFQSLKLGFDKARTQAANAQLKTAATLANDIFLEFRNQPGWTTGS